MNVQNLAVAIGSLRAVLIDYGIDRLTQDEMIHRFSQRLIQEELSLALSLPHLEERHAQNH